MRTLLLLLAAALIPAAASAADMTKDCRVGVYRMADGSVLDVGPSAGQTLRWKRKDGTSGALTSGADGVWTSTLGWTNRPDGHSASFDCAAGKIAFDKVRGQRIVQAVQNTRFQGDGVELAGRLILPPGKGKVPIVILLHGSEDSSANDFNWLQRIFPTEGIGVFIFDKRGTGASTGKYTQNFTLLANDAVAALNEAKRMAGPRAGRIGYQGPSQGGWIAPLAATRQKVDFVIVGFGLAVSMLDEDREAIALDMTEQGYGPDIMAKAMEVADASAVLATSDFNDGFDHFDALRAKYQGEPWFRHLRGNFTGVLLDIPPADREKVKAYRFDASWTYDPMPTLRALNTPQLWILGGADKAAPSAETLRRLAGLQKDGRPIVTALYPAVDHGIYEFETGKDGVRLSTRSPAGYLPMMVDWIRDGRLKVDYGAKVAPSR